MVFKPDPAFRDFTKHYLLLLVAFQRTLSAKYKIVCVKQDTLQLPKITQTSKASKAEQMKATTVHFTVNNARCANTGKYYVHKNEVN